ncbi:MAG: ABC transporter substrate-binding protein [Rhodobacteraceae bacterium]|nr:ABC transporter substrate-binding protein [Paracoccaceae bacterium]
MKALRPVAAAVVAVGLIAAASGIRADPTGDSIDLGAVFNITGTQAVFGVPSRAAADLAAAKINAAGGVLGLPLQLSHIDGNSSPEDLGALVRARLGETGDLAALFGLADTDLALSAAGAAAEAGRVFLTSGATSPKLPAEVPGFLFLACFGDNVQAAAAAEWAYGRKGFRTVLVLFEDDKTYPKLLKDYFVTRFGELGGTIQAALPITPRGAEIGLPEIGHPDAIFLSVTTAEDAAPVIGAIRAAGYAGPILGGDGYDAEAIWAAHPEISDVFFTTHVYLGPDNPDPAIAEFVAAYTTETGEVPNGFAALAYDAVGLLAAAMTAEGSADPDRIGPGLHAIGAYHGLTGTISYPTGTRIPRKSVTILEVAAGKQGLVETLMPTQVPPP